MKVERERLSAYRFQTPITTRWADNDIYGHINNVSYLGYVDSIINRYLIREGGLDIAGGEVIGLVVESRCQFFAPLTYPEEFVGALRVDRLGTSSVTHGAAIFAAGYVRNRTTHANRSSTSFIGHMTRMGAVRVRRPDLEVPGAVRALKQALPVRAEERSSSSAGSSVRRWTAPPRSATFRTSRFVPRLLVKTTLSPSGVKIGWRSVAVPSEGYLEVSERSCFAQVLAGQPRVVDDARPMVSGDKSKFTPPASASSNSSVQRHQRRRAAGVDGDAGPPRPRVYDSRPAATLSRLPVVV